MSATEHERSGDLIDDMSGMESLLMEAQNDQLEHHLKHEMVMKRWASHYDCDTVQKLMTVMMRHWYQCKHGDEALQSAGEFCEGYNPLTFKMGVNKIN